MAGPVCLGNSLTPLRSLTSCLKHERPDGRCTLSSSQCQIRTGFSSSRLQPASSSIQRCQPAGTHLPGARQRSRHRSRSRARPLQAAASNVATPGPSEAGVETEVAASPATLTYLEHNSWLWEIAGVRLLVDPILEGALDFGIPLLFQAKKTVLKDFTVDSLPPLDALLVTQSLDDHCHMRTLAVLGQRYPDLPVVATRNAEPQFATLPFKNVTFIAPTESTTLTGKNGVVLRVYATAGPVLGPPWQRPENGYVVAADEPKSISILYEPHCVYDAKTFPAKVDVVITPVIKQVFPGETFQLVSGQEDALALADSVKARYLVPLMNGDLDFQGPLSKIVSDRGSVDSFKGLVAKAGSSLQVLEAAPGKPLAIPL